MRLRATRCAWRESARCEAARRGRDFKAFNAACERLRDVVLRGDLYRLESPYERPRAALSYVSEDRTRAVLFIYQLGESAFGPIRLRGLDPVKRYRVREVDLPEGVGSRLALHEKVVDGATLLEEGIASPLRRALESAVVEIFEEPR